MTSCDVVINRSLVVTGETVHRSLLVEHYAQQISGSLLIIIIFCNIVLFSQLYFFLKHFHSSVSSHNTMCLLWQPVTHYLSDYPQNDAWASREFAVTICYLGGEILKQRNLIFMRNASASVSHNAVVVVGLPTVTKCFFYYYLKSHKRVV